MAYKFTKLVPEGTGGGGGGARLNAPTIGLSGDVLTMTDAEISAYIDRLKDLRL